MTHQFKILKLNEIIDVNFRSSLPTVTFIQERVNDLNFQLAATIYHDRKKNAVNRVEKVLELVESEVCRAKQIINYFGQETSNCGICDWCKKNEWCKKNCGILVNEWLYRVVDGKNIIVEKLKEFGFEDKVSEFESRYDDYYNIVCNEFLK